VEDFVGRICWQDFAKSPSESYKNAIVIKIDSTVVMDDALNDLVTALVFDPELEVLFNSIGDPGDEPYSQVLPSLISLGVDTPSLFDKIRFTRNINYFWVR